MVTPGKDASPPPGACSDIRDTCIVGEAHRHEQDPARLVAEALDRLLYQGVRPSQQPLTRAEAVDKIRRWHCKAHRAEADAILATISPGLGFRGGRKTPPPPALRH